MHLFKPIRVVSVGDKPETDIAGVLAAGGTAIWMNCVGRSAGSNISAHATIHDMEDLLALFELV
ncbi:MAG: hypothetical protein H6963_03725 [Chromatiaceae bacterium]|nr:hypothetical protein [Chromatiaceae bacterium]